MSFLQWDKFSNQNIFLWFQDILQFSEIRLGKSHGDSSSIPQLKPIQTRMKSLLHGKYWTGVKWEDEDG